MKIVSPKLIVSHHVLEKKEFIGRPFPLEYVGLEVYPILANDVCPNEKLDDIAIEYRFLYDELVAINFVAINDDRNIPSEKLTLMKYVKKTYGQTLSIGCNKNTAVCKSALHALVIWAPATQAQRASSGRGAPTRARTARERAERGCCT